MSRDSIKCECFICNNQFTMGPHVYDLRHIDRYNIHVCRVCYDGNWDGWAPDYEKRLIKHLEDQGLPIPERNPKGFLPRE